MPVGRGLFIGLWPGFLYWGRIWLGIVRGMFVFMCTASCVYMDMRADLSLDGGVFRVVRTFTAAQNIDGGYGGGHGQLSHCAPSYAAILSLAMVGGEEALDSIDRRSLFVDYRCNSTERCVLISVFCLP